MTGILVCIAFLFGVRIGFIRAKSGYKSFIGNEKE